MDWLATIGGSVKAIRRRSVPFSEFGQYGSEGISFVDDGRNWGPLASNFFGGTSPGAGYDYRAAAGEPLHNSVVAACVNAIAQALQDAPPILEQRQGNEWAKVDSHPVIDLLNQPNDHYGAAHLWAATAGSEVTRGQAFWRLEFDRGGVPREIWWENADRMRPIGTAQKFIASYELKVEGDGKPIPLAPEQVIHFRHALNPHNPRVGWTPLYAGYRQLAGDNGAASYHGAILRNSGVLSLLISAKEAQVSGGQLGVSGIEEFAHKLKAKLFGEGAGGIAATSIPVDIAKMSYSPDEMALDKLISYYEARICALVGVDPMVCGLGSGTQQKTYANMQEALNDFWERRIVPTKNRHSTELGIQLLPLFDLSPSDYRISWDYSKVAPLQENEDELHTRIREDYKAGVMDLMDARTVLNLDTTEEMRGHFAQGNFTDEEEPEVDDKTEEKSEAKSLEWSDEELDALTDDLTADDVKQALALATPAMRELLTAQSNG